MTAQDHRDEDARIAALLDHLARDEAPLGSPLRARILADHAAATAAPARPRYWRGWLAGALAGLPAAAAGLWIGAAQPALVLGVVPGIETGVGVPSAPSAGAGGDGALLDEVFGSWEDEA